MQSVFSVAARRTPYPEFRAGKSRAGALKTCWTKPWHAGGRYGGSNGGGARELRWSSGSRHEGLWRQQRWRSTQQLEAVRKVGAASAHNGADWRDSNTLRWLGSKRLVGDVKTCLGTKCRRADDMVWPV